MRPSSLVACVVLVVSTQAGASGSYGASLLSPSFRYSYTQNMRIAFADDGQAQSYMAREDAEFKARYLAFQAKAEKAIAAARKAGTPVGPYDLLLPPVRLAKPGDVAKLDKAAYPLNLVLDVDTPEAKASFQLTATKPWTAAQLSALTATLKKLAHQPFQPSDEQAALVEAAGFTKPIAVTQLDERFGLYVGTTTEVPAAEREKLLASLQVLLDKALPLLRAKFESADAAAQLGFAGLEPIGPVVAKHPQGLPRAFHPWGPLLSGALLRYTIPLGNAAAIVMVAPSGKYEWSKVAPALRDLLNEVFADAHRALVEREAERLSGDER